MKAKFFQRRLTSLFTRGGLNRISKARVRRFIVGQVAQSREPGTGNQK